MKATLINFLHLGWEKITYAICCGWIFSFIVPIRGFLIFTVFVVFADMATGILAAKKEGQKITSKGLYRTSEKILVYFTSIMIFHGAQLTFGIPLPIVYLASSIIAGTELFSVAENVKRITGVNLATIILKFFKK